METKFKGELAAVSSSIKTVVDASVKGQLDNKILPRMESQGRWWAVSTIALFAAMAAAAVWARRKYVSLKKSHLL